MTKPSIGFKVYPMHADDSLYIEASTGDFTKANTASCICKLPRERKQLALVLAENLTTALNEIMESSIIVKGLSNER